MEKTTAQKLKLGIFVIIGTALLVAAIYFVGSRQNVFGSTFEITAVFKNVNGLQRGNNVRFSGINIGTVTGIEMSNDTTIRVRLLIEEKMKAHIRKDAIASLGTDGLVGSMLINITPGLGKANLVEPGDEIRTYSRIASEDMLSTLNVTNENAALLTSDLLKITQSLIYGKGTLGRLLNDTLMARDMYEAVANLKDISIEVNRAMQEVRTLLAQVHFEGSAAEVLLSDTVSGEKVRKMIQNMEEASMELNGIVENLNGTLEKMNEGDGTIPYLLNDTVLVRQLDASMQNIQEGTARFNENMEALQHHFLFRRYFRKKAAKEAQK